MPNLFYAAGIVDGQCGVGRLYRCHTVESYNRAYNAPTTEQELAFNFRSIPEDRALKGPEHAGGTGLFGTGFIPDERSKLLYEALCKHHKLVFQTPVRLNNNSKNMFFYAMFDDKVNKDITYIEPNWPFKEEQMQ